MNPYKFQVVEWYRSFPYGTPNKIVASAATLKGCLSQYKKHLRTMQAPGVKHAPVKTVFYCDNIPFDVAL